jgi:hypothetical protein
MIMNLQEQITRIKKMMGLNEELQSITTSSALKREMFGPVYHGTTQEKHERIGIEGFKIFYGGNEVRHGYPNKTYGNTGYPPPIHHLGYGIYFTTNKSIAKNFNLGSMKNVKSFFLDVHNIEIINFGSPRKMMDWWMSNGYDAERAKESEANRIEETKKMTEVLKSKYDAVWFKGKSMYKLLDGDQIVVFDPALIYKIDDSNVKGYEVGAKVRLTNDLYQQKYNDNKKDIEIAIPSGMVGIITKIEIMNEGHLEWLMKNPDLNVTDEMTDAYVKYWKDSNQKKINGDHKYYTVKFKKGGTQRNITSLDIEPI